RSVEQHRRWLAGGASSTADGLPEAPAAPPMACRRRQQHRRRLAGGALKSFAFPIRRITAIPWECRR
ncbi:MAG: hypothetical protein OEW39_05215, partial [Deltaproteobacteria bacterium]|nr:hypothetical protein [Deltaproteobacteria bacterium]